MARKIARLPATTHPATKSPLRQPQGSGMLSDQAWAEIARSLELSGRELQIVRGLFDDRIEYAIAADLGISPHTVHTHIERLHHKLAVPDRAQLLIRVIKEFLMLTTSPVSTLPPICANRAAGRCPLGL